MAAADSSDKIINEIRDYIATAFLVDFETQATLETDLFQEYIDSFGFVDLVTYVEKQFQIKLTEDDLVSPAIGSVAGLHEIVVERIRGCGGN